MSNILTTAVAARENTATVTARLVRINTLIRDRKFEVADAWESMEDILNHREIDLTFGSTGYEYRVPRGSGRLDNVSANGDLHTIFLHGYCPLFACAAHERTGLPFAVFSLPDTGYGWSGHVGIDIGENQFLDITGVRSTIPMDLDPRYARTTLDRNEFLGLLVGAEHREDPLGFVDELERLLTEQAVHEVLLDAGLL